MNCSERRKKMLISKRAYKYINNFITQNFRKVDDKLMFVGKVPACILKLRKADRITWVRNTSESTRIRSLSSLILNCNLVLCPVNVSFMCL